MQKPQWQRTAWQIHYPTPKLLHSPPHSQSWRNKGQQSHLNWLNCALPRLLPCLFQPWLICCMMMATTPTMCNSLQVSWLHSNCKHRWCTQLIQCLLNLSTQLTKYLLQSLAPKPAHSLAAHQTGFPQQPHTQSATQLPFSCPTNTFRKPEFHLGLCTTLTPATN